MEPFLALSRQRFQVTGRTGVCTIGAKCPRQESNLCFPGAWLGVLWLSVVPIVGDQAVILRAKPVAPQLRAGDA